ncbi:MAG: phosphoribosylanthranilate isomerase [Gemmatimonadaceae bacterium]
MAPEIKFCGLTRAVDAGHGAALGADYLGVVLAPSPRRVTMHAARDMFGSLGDEPRRVGVFVEPSVHEVLTAIEGLRLHAVQLHGAMSVETLDAIRADSAVSVWCVVPVVGGRVADSARVVVTYCDVLLFDTSVEGRTGGTGRAFDWAAARTVLDGFRDAARIALAGGLHAGNVASAVHALSPDIVDVSSGIEASPGIKDHDRMTAFAEAVRGNR